MHHLEVRYRHQSDIIWDFFGCEWVEFPLCPLLNILRQEQADGCKQISYGILITFQDSNPTGTVALISCVELNNMDFLNNHSPGVKLAGKHRGD